MYFDVLRITLDNTGDVKLLKKLLIEEQCRQEGHICGRNKID